MPTHPRDTSKKPRPGSSETEQDFLDETVAVWQPYYSEPLTREDAREIAHNAIGFIKLLRSWALEEKRMSADRSPCPAIVDGNNADDSQ